MPEVSAVIPAYNAARYLPEAVDSVLGQTFQDLEILVVDDGSTDGTEEVLRRYGPRIRYLRKPNGGMADARNYGIEHSRGRYVGFLDADDTWLPHKLERQLAALSRHPECRMCYSAFTIVDGNLTPLSTSRSQRHGSTLEDLLLRGNIVGSVCTALCERTLFATAGTFDPLLKFCADWDLWIRIARLTEFHYVDEALVTYRQHGGNFSRHVGVHERDGVAILERAFDGPALPDSLRARRGAALARHYRVLSGCYFHARQYRDGFRCAARALSLDYGQAGYLMAFPVRQVKRLWQGQVAEAV